MHLLQVPLASCIPFQNWDPPLYGQLKKPLSPRYFFLSRSKQILLSPLSSLNIHLDKIHSFVSFVSVNPSPPASFGVIITSHLAIWYFFLRPGPCQKKICSSSIHFMMNFVLQHVKSHGEGTHGAVAKGH